MVGAIAKPLNLHPKSPKGNFTKSHLSLTINHYTLVIRRRSPFKRLIINGSHGA